MIYETKDDKVEFRNVANSTNFANFLHDGQLYLKIANPEAGLNAVNLSTNRVTWFGKDVLVEVVQVKIVDVK